MMSSIFVVAAAFPWNGTGAIVAVGSANSIIGSLGWGFALWRLSVRVTQPFEQINSLAKELAGCRAEWCLPACLLGRHPMALLMERFTSAHQLGAVVVMRAMKSIASRICSQRLQEPVIWRNAQTYRPANCRNGQSTVQVPTTVVESQQTAPIM